MGTQSGQRQLYLPRRVRQVAAKGNKYTWLRLRWHDRLHHRDRCRALCASGGAVRTDDD